MERKKDLAILLLGAFMLTVVPLGLRSSVTSHASTALSTSAGSMLDAPCNNLMKANSFAQHLEIKEKEWKYDHAHLASRDLSAWLEARQEFETWKKAKRKDHYQRVIECTKTRPRSSRRLIYLVGESGGFVTYPSTIDLRAQRHEAARFSLRSERRKRLAFFRMFRQEGRKTRRAIRREHMERLASERLNLP